jgi:hypothetical protein
MQGDAAALDAASGLSPNQYWVRDDTDSLGSALAVLQQRRYRGTWS